jgi:hypothetical protein
MRIEVFGSDIVVVGMTTSFGVTNHAIAITIPLIEVIARRSFANLVLLVGAAALNRDELILSYARATLRSSDFDLAFADENFGVIVSSYKNSKAGFAALGANGDVRSIDLGIGIAVFEDGVIRHAVAKLNLNLRMGELHKVGLRMLSEAQHVGVIQLKLGSGLVSG